MLCPFLSSPDILVYISCCWSCPGQFTVTKQLVSYRNTTVSIFTATIHEVFYNVHCLSYKDISQLATLSRRAVHHHCITRRTYRHMDHINRDSFRVFQIIFFYLPPIAFCSGSSQFVAVSYTMATSSLVVPYGEVSDV